ncbi:MAG: hypothetical protein WKG07_25505 [Hymenobacter sp.]
MKTYEEKILNAEEQLFVIESRIYQEVMLAALDYREPGCSRTPAPIGACWIASGSFAATARQHRYVRPVVNDGPYPRASRAAGTR